MFCTPKVRPTILTFGVFFVVNYDEEFKQKVVYTYLAGKGGYAALSTRFGVPCKMNIRKCVSYSLRNYYKKELVLILCC